MSALYQIAKVHEIDLPLRPLSRQRRITRAVRNTRRNRTLAAVSFPLVLHATLHAISFATRVLYNSSRSLFGVWRSW